MLDAFDDFILIFSAHIKYPAINGRMKHFSPCARRYQRHIVSRQDRQYGFSLRRTATLEKREDMLFLDQRFSIGRGQCWRKFIV